MQNVWQLVLMMPWSGRPMLKIPWFGQSSGQVLGTPDAHDALVREADAQDADPMQHGHIHARSFFFSLLTSNLCARLQRDYDCERPSPQNCKVERV